MIEIEASPEAFRLSVDGRKVLSHSRRLPCVEVGIAENIVRSKHVAARLHARRCVATKLRSYKIVENSPSFVAIDFEDRLRMALRQEGSVLRISFSSFDSAVNHFRFRLASTAEESIFGCGSSADQLDRKGRKVQFWALDRGIVRGRGFPRFFARLAHDLTSSRGCGSHPIAAFVSTRNYWCAIEGLSYGSLEFRRASTVLTAWNPPAEIAWGYGESAARTASSLASFSASPRGLPEWCFDGAMLEVRGGMDRLLSRLDTALRSGVKLSALWSRDLFGALPSAPDYRAQASLAWDSKLYPSLPRTVAELRGRGIRCIAAVSSALDLQGPLYAEASRLGYCVKNSAKADYLVPLRSGQAALLDLTSDKARLWFREKLLEGPLALGLSGLLADGGEELPPDAILASGESALFAHNRWPGLWAETCRKALDEAFGADDGERILLCRSSHLGSQSLVNAVWLGESLPVFEAEDGLSGSISSALSLGLSGSCLCHAEAGGSLSAAGLRRRAPLFRRWIEIAAFSPLLRLGDSFRPELNTQVWNDADCLASLARMSEIFAALKPYHEAVAGEAAAEAMPAIRHPWLHYESDPIAARLQNQYLYGRDLMVAATLSPRAQSTRLYLPKDEWVHLWTSRTFRGGEIAVESAYGYPAVFYRASSPFAALFEALRRNSGRAR